MTNKITEYSQHPKWIDNLSSEEIHKWYITVKRDLDKFKELGDASDLEQAILDYEKRYGI